ncbi:DNA-directed RNA polymerase subunit beta [Patescibacteria group bacterium]|nr:DNA-directed RNA polymerase subunit beta [Patescibacteria group bacterium]
MFRKKRENWGNETHKLPILDLVKIQLDSYSDFLNNQIGASLLRVNPIKDFSGKAFQFEFLSHKIDNPQITPKEALEKGITFDAPLWAMAKLTNLKTNQVQEKKVFLGDIPLMTSIGTFVINGVERVVINQLVRSPGVYFTRELDPQSGRHLYKAEIRPIHGSWIEIMVSKNDHLSVRIDRRRKISVTTLLRAIGFSTNEEIESLFNDVDTDEEHPYIATTLLKDSSSNTDEALLEFYEKIRPGEPAVIENAKNLLKQMFFDSRRYNLGEVGRYKINKKLTGLYSSQQTTTTLTKDDLVATIKYLIALQNGKGKTDDIDHLANRRLRQVGELVNQTALRRGLLSLERSIREKMSLAKPEELHTPASFVNPRPVVAAIAEFFRRNRLSAILDQINPLSEIDTIRRVTVMGPGGVTKERASFSMRDIHNSQYSKIGPIRSPEGPNIGLVTYLALFTKVNKYGFLQAPYLKVEQVSKNNKQLMKIGKEITYLTADDEEDYYITHAGVGQQNGYITDKWIACRYQGEFIEADVNRVQYIDVVPCQVVSTSASLIPFVHHDDGIRALMGSHMQTQAVPLLKPESPVVGTGMEGAIASSMGWVVKARHAGTVVSSDAQHVSIKISEKDATEANKNKLQTDYGYIQIKNNIETYQIRKFYRTSQNTSYSQNPLVIVGDRVELDDLIINGPASDGGELALGQNLLIAYMSFEGLGYEDAIVVSSRLLDKDLLSSIHISEHTAEVMDTKLGPEELTNDIPNVSEQDLRYLGLDGIIVPGSVVGPRDILVGKIAPKGETELTAEERLLRAIFGEKAREVRDTSLRLPHGDQGVIVNVQILDRNRGDELSPGVIQQVKVQVAQLRKITVGDKLAGRHGNKGVISKIVPTADMPYLASGRPIDIIISPLSVLARMNLGQLLEAQLGIAAEAQDKKIAVPVFEQISEEKINKLQTEAGLPTSGKMQLYDGRTGEKFLEETAIGIAYILKLIHMVEDKTHARSTGPYSLVTQQPLGGKAQRGGQRLGEMEVWALEAHKAAHILQEMLTIKSDDVVGRSKAFEAIVKGLPIPEPSLPESFKVLVKELNALSLSVLPMGKIETISNKDTEKDSSEESQISEHVSSNVITNK